MSQRGFQIVEGRITFQKPFLKKFLQEESWIKNVLEIGFNAGHSADFMLSQRDDISVTSVDIAKHQYTVPCANFLSEKYPDRLKFMIGDSRYTLSEIDDKFENPLERCIPRQWVGRNIRPFKRNQIILKVWQYVI